MADSTVRPVDSFGVLAVCTGNIGRSPMIERVLRSRLSQQATSQGPEVSIAVSSAGTHAVPGSSMEPGAARALRGLGIDSSDFGAHQLDVETVQSADLVLVATREHRSQVVATVPSAVRRTFTLHELARIVQTAPAMPPVAAGTAPADRMRQAVAWAAQVRGSVARPEPDTLDDLVDALGEPDEVYRERADEVVASVERIVPYLLGSLSAG